MARGLILSLRMETMTTLPNPSTFLSLRHFRHYNHLLRRLRYSVPPLRCFYQSVSSAPEAVDMTNYHHAFSARMAMAGLKPHHRIALGVSGGPDSMALCVLTAHWKTNGLSVNHDCDGFIDGLLAIIVDHSLRAESKEEANIVSRRVSRMGLRCEIAHCEWLDGRPKQGHLQEAARDMRYRHFQKVCIQNQISALLIAQHVDDQAELFVLRLSRNSGVLGLAGMPFVSQIFSSYTHSCDSNDHGILLVRPLLDFSKEDMYKVNVVEYLAVFLSGRDTFNSELQAVISSCQQTRLYVDNVCSNLINKAVTVTDICQGGEQKWVEDPTNQSQLYARNRIRTSLRKYSSYTFNSELQAVISACQHTRLYIDNVCSNLINKAVTVTDLGYVVIDLEILKESKVEDICLSRFIALLLQFVSQRNRPIRGSTSKLLLDYMHTFPCKTSLTAAGCYLCPAPGSKGTKALVCYSVDHPLPQTKEFLNVQSYVEHQYQTSNDVEQIIAGSKLYLDRLVPDASKVHFLDITSESVLTEARRLNMLSESTCENILLLQRDEVKHFRTEKRAKSDFESKGKVKSISMYSEPLNPGQICSFMNRFFVTWKTPEETVCEQGLGGESWRHHFRSCMVGDEMATEVRHMAESDWLYLVNLVKSPTSFQQQNLPSASGDGKNLCLDYARYSAQRALRILKSVPVAARRGLPVLINSQGLLLSIPVPSFFPFQQIRHSAVF
ncbi:hypothetical protein L484_001879 [Morus notabilis]|uniref:tRNA(Ile)-lysidine synthetase n=1 Tax=Morus notabilis TaxID=981085 RepID=W9RJX0_9ROSA|nr:hypothetical protein L484_001879 [Morus notabilis]